MMRCIKNLFSYALTDYVTIVLALMILGITGVFLSSCQITTKPEHNIVADPVFTPDGGVFDSLTIVSLSSATDNCVIRYTVDGSEPTVYSTIYDKGVALTKSATIKAKAYKLFWTPSSITSASYIVHPYQEVAAPTFSPAGGIWDSVDVSIACTTSGAYIRYTMDGSEPDSSSTIYSGQIHIYSSTTLKAKAFKDDWIPSETASASYSINIYTVAMPTITPAGGSYSSIPVVTLNCETEGATIRYTTDGTDPTQNSTPYTNPIYIAASATLKVKGFKEYWASSLAAKSNFVVTITPTQMVYVMGGTYLMGDTYGEGSSHELPVHSVTLSPYYLGKYEVTQAEWAEIMGSNPATGEGLGNNYPAFNISSYAALVYCNLRSMSEGLDPCYVIMGSANPSAWGPIPSLYNHQWSAFVYCYWDNNGYRLPSEAEWEYAARGASNQPDYRFSGSNNVNEVAWYMGTSTTDGPSPVGTKNANALGIYDMSGNLWEWIWDGYDDEYYSISPQDNPPGPTGDGTRIVRGGAWSYGVGECRVSCRGFTYPHLVDRGVGFRVCRSAH